MASQPASSTAVEDVITLSDSESEPDDTFVPPLRAVSEAWSVHSSDSSDADVVCLDSPLPRPPVQQKLAITESALSTPLGHHLARTSQGLMNAHLATAVKNPVKIPESTTPAERSLSLSLGLGTKQTGQENSSKLTAINRSLTEALDAVAQRFSKKPRLSPVSHATVWNRCRSETNPSISCAHIRMIGL